MKSFSFLRIFRGGASPREQRLSQRYKVKPAVEALEDRQLLSGFGGLGFFLASNRNAFSAAPKPVTTGAVHSTSVATTAVHTTSAAAPAPKQTTVNTTVSVAATSPTKQTLVVDGAQDPSTNQSSMQGAVNDGTATRTVRLVFGSGTTDWSQTKTLAQFNLKLGTLTGVEITNSGSLTSRIRVESLDSAPADVTGTVSGNLTLTGAVLSLPLVTTTNAETEDFHAAAYDRISDFGGVSGQDFGNKSSDGSQTLVLTNAGDLTKFIGLGQVSLTETAQATSSAAGAGNLLTQITSTAQANVTILYRYIPAPPPVTVTSIPSPPPPVSPPATPLSKRMFLASTFRHTT